MLGDETDGDAAVPLCQKGMLQGEVEQNGMIETNP